MARFVSQTQDCPSPFSSQEESLNKQKHHLLQSMEHSELCAIDPAKKLFFNEKLAVFANKETVKIIKHLLDSSQHVTKLRSHVSKHGFLSKHDAAVIIRDLVLFHLSSSQSDLVPAQSRTLHHNWAFGVLLCVLLCGPPPNNHSMKHIDFYNQIGLGVIVAPSKWFGSSQKRRKWSQLDFESKVLILKLVHTELKVCAVAFSEDSQWSECLLQNGWCTDRNLFEDPCLVSKELGGLKMRDQLPKSSINCKSPACEKTSLVGSCVDQQKMPFSRIKGKKKFINKGGRAMDVASFREILRIQRLDNDAFSEKHVACCQQRQSTSDEWNGFWTKAAKMEEKKKRKPLTVVQSKERRKKKARLEIIRGLNDLKKPISHLFDNPDLYL